MSKTLAERIAEQREPYIDPLSSDANGFFRGWRAAKESDAALADAAERQWREELERLEALYRECRDKLRGKTYSQTSFVYGSDTQKQKWAEWDIATEAAIAVAKDQTNNKE